MELYGDAMEFPPVHAKVVLGEEDLTVKVRTYKMGSHTDLYLDFSSSLLSTVLSIIILYMYSPS